jgi:hypothetical protein
MITDVQFERHEMKWSQYMFASLACKERGKPCKASLKIYDLWPEIQALLLATVL